MCAPKAPKAPDPKETAAAQTGTNVTTAIANGYLGNINQVTPDGKLVYSYGGMKTVKDPTTGATYQVPTTTVTQTLSKAQQAIKTQQDLASKNLATVGATQSGRLNGLLSTPFNLDGAPAAGDPNSLQAPNYQQFSGGPQLQTGVQAGNIANSFGTGGNIQTGLGNTGRIQTGLADAGSINKAIRNAGNIQTGLGDAGDITKSYDIDIDTSKYEDALMQRMNPQLQQSRQAVETQLRSRGLQPGSVAFDRALDAATRQENDARYGAILNAGQEQSRLAGLAQNKAGFENSAQQQGYQQMLASGQFANSAQAQKYSQNANDAAFGNQAQQQQFNQNLGAGQFANSAQAQQLQTALAAGQFANSAQQQQYAQNQGLAAFGNEPQQQSFTQGLANAQFGNTANQQMYGNQNSAIGANNALQDQNFNAQQARLNAQNQARATYQNEQYALRNQPLNEISALMSGGQVTAPQFVPTQGQSMPTVDYAGLVNQKYQGDVAAYNAQQGALGGALGGLASMFSFSPIKLSDKTTKRNIKKVGSLDGHGLYRYNYKGKHDDGKQHIGVMAQDVKKTRPDAVVRRHDGKLAVNYGALFQAGA
jgi:hypothetical protein